MHSHDLGYLAGVIYAIRYRRRGHERAQKKSLTSNYSAAPGSRVTGWVCNIRFGGSIDGRGVIAQKEGGGAADGATLTPITRNCGSGPRAFPPTPRRHHLNPSPDSLQLEAARRGTGRFGVVTRERN